MSEIITRSGSSNGDRGHPAIARIADCVTFFMPTDEFENLKLENLLNLNENKELGEIIGRARDFARLTEVLALALPEDLREGLVAASVSPDGELVVFGQSPAWAARLRYEATAMLEAARATGQSATRVRVRVSHQSAER